LPNCAVPLRQLFANAALLFAHCCCWAATRAAAFAAGLFPNVKTKCRMETSLSCQRKAFSVMPFLPRSALSLAVALALLVPEAAVRAEDAGVPLNVAQATLPAAGTTDIERSNATQTVGRINADYAYARGITGKGVTIATMDSGISASSREFSAPGKLAPGYNAVTGTSDVTDVLGHGTHVAGIIAADRDGKGIFGVAYDATLLPIKVLSDGGRGSTNALDAGLRYAIGKAFIVNMSLSADAAYSPAALQQAVKGGLLIVAAAGNDAAANPGWPARFAKESWANNQIIAVGAVDANNHIAGFSNRAGDTAAWFLVAPGVGILSTYLNGQYAYMSGTSMATPVVSGAAALIKQMWPALKAEQIANILFVTATDLGAPGIDPIYGRGLVNVEKAMQPVGALTTTTYNGKTISVLSGSTQVSAATSRLWSLAASGQLQVIGFDAYRRDFRFDAGATVVQPPSLSLDQVFDGIDRRLEVADRVLRDGSEYLAAYETRRASDGGIATGTRRLAAFSLVSRVQDGEFAFGSGGLAAHYFGAGSLRPEHGSLHGAQQDSLRVLQLGGIAALANPYFVFLPGATHAGWAQHFGSVTLRFGTMASGPGATLVGTDALHVPQAHAALFEASTSFDRVALSLSLSRIDERSGYLGSYSSGPLAFNGDASTRALQLAGAVLLTPKLALAAQAAYGVTPGSLVSGSLITEVAKTRTNAFGLALVASDRFLADDRLSIALSQPMRAYAGQVAMDMLTGLDENGNEMRERTLFSMVPLGRELRAEVNYLVPLHDAASVGVTLMLRREPNNMIEAAAEKLLALRYEKRY
jgi:hypothetical protein